MFDCGLTKNNRFRYRAAAIIVENDADIKQIFVNGKTAEKYYNKYIRYVIGREAVCLPSTSPANAGWSMERLVDAWSLIKVSLSD